MKQRPPRLAFLHHAKQWCAPAPAALTFVIVSLLGAAQPAGAQQAMAAKAYDVVRLADGVHAFVWQKPLDNPIEGNALFIINANDVVVVDTGFFADTAALMASELKKLTPLPVRYVVNTHWHDDHHGGNSVYQALWPGVEVIAHRDTRTDIIEKTYAVRANSAADMSKNIRTYRQWLVNGKDDAGKLVDQGRRVRIENILGFLEASLPKLANLREAPPTLTFTDQLVLFRGGRRIELRWLGLGNTRGDIVVYLPRERIVATGDLLVLPVPFAFGSNYGEWPATLAKLAALEVDVLVPGHGPIQHDRVALHTVREMLQALVAEVQAAASEGLSLEETLGRVSLTPWRVKLAGDDPALAAAFSNFVLRAAIESIWKKYQPSPSVSTTGRKPT